MYSFGSPQIDDEGVQIQLFKDGMPSVTGIALHNGKGPEETTLRAACDARRAYKQIRAAFTGVGSAYA